MFPARFSLRPAWPQQLDRQAKVFAFLRCFGCCLRHIKWHLDIYGEKFIAKIGNLQYLHFGKIS